jgi:hypothetical protein
LLEIPDPIDAAIVTRYEKPPGCLGLNQEAHLGGFRGGGHFFGHDGDQDQSGLVLFGR